MKKDEEGMKKDEEGIKKEWRMDKEGRSIEG